MTEIEFRTKKKQNLSYIQNCINKVNELARQNDPIRFFSDRLNLIVLACNKVTECQELYLEYCNGIRYEPKEVIKFDYTTSEYANRLYSASQKMIRYYLMNKEDKKGLESALVGFFRRLPEQEQYRTLGFAQALVSTQEEK